MDSERITFRGGGSVSTLGRRRAIAGLLAGVAITRRADPSESRKRKKCKAKNKNQDEQNPRLAASCQGPNPGEAGGNGMTRFARTFTPVKSGSLHSIEVVASRIAGSGDVSLQLVRVRGGVPSSSPVDVLAVAIIPDADVPADLARLTGRFSGPALVAGTEYAVVVSGSGGGIDLFGLRITSDTGCAGQMFRADGGGPFTDLPFDMPIAVFVA